MGRYVSMQRKNGGLWFCLAVVAASWGAGAPAQENPWTSERQRALVRIEAPKQGAAPSVGTGFIVKGRGGQFYIITATHAVVPDAPEVPASAECLPLLNGTRLFQTNRGGRQLLGNCVRHVGRDISLITLEPGDGDYPTLPLSTRELPNRDWVHLAGYPEGGSLDANRSGKVTSWDPTNQVLITDMATTGGMSGGPYLDDYGYVVGVHRGGLKFQTGFARLTPIWTMESDLERYLPDISDVRIAPVEPRPGGQEEVRVEAAREEGIWGDAAGENGAGVDVMATPRMAIAVTTTLADPGQRREAEINVVKPLAVAVFERFQSATGDETPVLDSATMAPNAADLIRHLATIVFDRTLNRANRVLKVEVLSQSREFRDFRVNVAFDVLFLIDVDRVGSSYRGRTALIHLGEDGGTYSDPVVTMRPSITIDLLDLEAFRTYAASLQRSVAEISSRQ